VCRAELFQVDDAKAKSDFRNKLKAIVEQNRDVAQILTAYLEAPQVTDVMTEMRASSLDERKATYANGRIANQLRWYAMNAALNRKSSNNFFWALIAANAVAVVCSIVRIQFVEMTFWPTDIFVAIAASLLSWMQAKRFSELAASYALAAHEIGLIREQTLLSRTESEFSQFVGDAENAFSREHTVGR
jgi:SMODS and SLOG-associating 2TM effector domain 1/SMODS and SLOG-associating 2TM effector domain 3